MQGFFEKEGELKFGKAGLDLGSLLESHVCEGSAVGKAFGVLGGTAVAESTDKKEIGEKEEREEKAVLWDEVMVGLPFVERGRW